MKVIVLGGDGFCGWPTCLHLAANGHDVLIMDNFARRKIDIELGTESLTPIRSLFERLEAWHGIGGRFMRFYSCDVSANYEQLLDIFRREQPDAIVHFAEQRAAPYSMKSSWHKRYTVNNNLNATNNVLAAIVEACPRAHLVHLGTMGVYGYGSAGFKFPEGYLKIKVERNGTTEEQEILHPSHPGSIYHMTKSQDQLFFAFYNKNDGVRITDLHQGIVWGTQTAETRLDDRLINRFDYDGDFGTVLNRFLMQAALGYPLTVHSGGGQKRAFIHIEDTVRCIQLAIATPPAPGERVRILNQMTEVHQVMDLANLVARLTGARIQTVQNPRHEAADNELDAENGSLLTMGLNPTTMASSLLEEMVENAARHRERCILSKIPCDSYWNRDIRTAADQANQPHSPAPPQ